MICMRRLLHRPAGQCAAMRWRVTGGAGVARCQDAWFTPTRRLIVVASIAIIALSSVWLPVRIASHFGAAGVPNGFMTRGTYLAFMAVVVIGIPALLSAIIGAAIRRSPGSINIPHRDYWLAPARREATAEYLVRHTARLAAGVALFAVALHFVLIHANALSPPRLAAPLLWLPLAGALLGVALWIISLRRRFRLP